MKRVSLLFSSLYSAVLVRVFPKIINLLLIFLKWQTNVLLRPSVVFYFVFISRKVYVLAPLVRSVICDYSAKWLRAAGSLV